MRRYLFELRLWDFTSSLLKKNFEFYSQDEADHFALGFYNAYLELGKNVTGYAIEKLN